MNLYFKLVTPNRRFSFKCWSFTRWFAGTLVGVFVCVLPLRTVAQTVENGTAPTFTLEAARGGRLWGPYSLRNRSRLTLAGQTYQLRIYLPDRLSFISLGSGRVFGPVQALDGRLVEIDGHMYAFAHVTEPLPSRPPLPPAPPEPPRPEPIPMPYEEKPVPPAPRPLLPRPAPQTRISVWLIPRGRTPSRWEVDQRNGAEADLERTLLGVDLKSHGWLARFGIVNEVRSDDILHTGLTVSDSSFSDGDGFLLEVGYRQPFLRENGWEAYGGLRASYRREQGRVTSRTASGVAGTNATVELDFQRGSASVTLSETALWLDAGLQYHADRWGLTLDLGIQPFGTITVDGKIPYGTQRLRLGLERDQPLLVAFGGWLDHESWRFFADYSLGSEERLRLGAGYRF